MGVSMITRFRSWFPTQPPSERKAIVVWAISLLILLVIGVFAFFQRSLGMSVYYYLFGLFLVDSALFFALYRQLPTMKVTMLTIIAVLELSVIGYYLIARTAIIQ